MCRLSMFIFQGQNIEFHHDDSDLNAAGKRISKTHGTNLIVRRNITSNSI